MPNSKKSQCLTAMLSCTLSGGEAHTTVMRSQDGSLAQLALFHVPSDNFMIPRPRVPAFLSVRRGRRPTAGLFFFFSAREIAFAQKQPPRPSLIRFRRITQLAHLLGSYNRRIITLLIPYTTLSPGSRTHVLAISVSTVGGDSDRDILSKKKTTMRGIWGSLRLTLWDTALPLGFALEIRITADR